MNLAPSRAALAALALSVFLAPALALHPAAKHAYAAGLTNAFDELLHPGMVGLILIGALSVLPALGLSLSLLAVVTMRRQVAALNRLSEPVMSAGFAYRRLASQDVLLFTAGALRPTTYVSSAAEQALNPDSLRAALLHEEGHRRCRDTFWRLLLLGISRGFGRRWWVARAVDAEVLRSECAADDYALRSGADRIALFEAIVTVATRRQVGVAELGGGNIELRLTRLVEPELAIPHRTTRNLLALNLATILPALATHGIAYVIAAHSSHLRF